MQSSLFRFPPLFGSLDCQAASFGIFHGVAQAQFALLAGFQLQSPGDDAALLVQLASAQLLADTAMALLRDTGSWSASVSTTGSGRVLRTENFHATVCVWFEPMARRDE